MLSFFDNFFVFISCGILQFWVFFASAVFFCCLISLRFMFRLDCIFDRHSRYMKMIYIYIVSLNYICCIYNPLYIALGSMYLCMYVSVYVCLKPISFGTDGPIWKILFLLVQSWSGEGFRQKNFGLSKKEIRGFFCSQFQIFLQNVDTTIGRSPKTPDSGKAARR